MELDAERKVDCSITKQQPRIRKLIINIHILSVYQDLFYILITIIQIINIECLLVMIFIHDTNMMNQILQILKQSCFLLESSQHPDFSFYESCILKCYFVRFSVQPYRSSTSHACTRTEGKVICTGLAVGGIGTGWVTAP